MLSTEQILQTVPSWKQIWPAPGQKSARWATSVRVGRKCAVLLGGTATGKGLQRLTAPRIALRGSIAHGTHPCPSSVPSRRIVRAAFLDAFLAFKNQSSKKLSKLARTNEAAAIRKVVSVFIICPRTVNTNDVGLYHCTSGVQNGTNVDWPDHEMYLIYY